MVKEKAALKLPRSGQDLIAASLKPPASDPRWNGAPADGVASYVSSENFSSLT